MTLFPPPTTPTPCHTPSSQHAGKYAVWSGQEEGEGWADWNDDYASKGYEFFDVWAPEMATHYGQVFWTDQGNNPIPAAVVERFKGKTMAIVGESAHGDKLRWSFRGCSSRTNPPVCQVCRPAPPLIPSPPHTHTHCHRHPGYEQDQVMVTPVGHPGVNPDKDVSVPINWAYNHHYMAYMTGAESELVSVDNEEGEGFGMGYHGRTTHNELREKPSFRHSGLPEDSSGQMFSEGNGGESRKSFHGFPKGYAQLISSPESWHITPMQIDTRNRACGVGPEHVHNCTVDKDGYPGFTPWMEPKQARYGRGIPNGGTNYSGVLECPCNGGYGGDPEYYGNSTKTKVQSHRYSAIGSGSCTSGQDMDGAQDCFDSAARLGVNAITFINKTVSSPKALSGCSVETSAARVATVTWNTAPGTQCVGSTTKVGQATSAVGVTVVIETGDTGNVSMVRNAVGKGNASEYCSNNHNQSNHANPNPFMAKSLSHADMVAAIAACEAFCMTDDGCNFCSVDDLGPDQDPIKGVRWWALKQCTPKAVKLPFAIPGDVSSKSHSGEANITISGPSTGWTGVGFNAGLMSDSPYTIVANSTHVWEQKIGTCGSEAEHCPGEALKNSLTVVSSATVAGRRTVVVTRGLTGLTKQHYSFNAAAQATIPFISAVGWSDVFAQHKVHAAAVVTLTNPVGAGATCLCDKGALAQLCEGDGTGCGSFIKNCVAAPTGSLLEQRNPTCSSEQYAGGLRCCHHNRIMLDEAQASISLAHETLRYHMKWRFWFQEYKPAATPHGQPSHYNLNRIYFQTEASAGEYDIPPAFYTADQPKITGYPGVGPYPELSPGSSCTGNCPDGDDCECVHTIHFNFKFGGRLIYAGGHCHAPSCKDIRLYRNDTGHEMELLCHQMPKYGTGNNTNPKTKEDTYDEPGYLALPYGNLDIVLAHVSGIYLLLALCRAPCGCRVMCPTWCPCLSGADCRLQSDVAPDPRLQAVPLGRGRGSQPIHHDPGRNPDGLNQAQLQHQAGPLRRDGLVADARW